MFVLVSISLTLSACGVKGPPEPPRLAAPGAPEKFKARMREGCVELKWLPPRIELPQYTPAVRYEVLRAEALPGQTPAYRLLDRTGDAWFIDCGLGLEERALYKVRGISDDGRRGAETGPVLVAKTPSPLAPLYPRTRAGDGYVEVSWDTPVDMPESAGFNVYRATEPLNFPWRPVNIEPVRGGRFIDGPLDNGVGYYYEIRAVVSVEGALAVEGPAGSLVRAVPADRVPPSPPRGFIAIWAEGGVLCRWLTSHEPDLKGYIVYRRLRGLGEFEELFLDPIIETRYVDKTARRGVEYEYTARALDGSQPPNVSPWSDIQVVYAEPW
jgi:hypothetical protein